MARPRPRLFALVRGDRGQVPESGQPGQRLRLELTHALARQVELVSDRLERPRLALEPEAKLEDPPLALGQRVQRAPTAWFSETDAWAAPSASSTCCIGSPVASASSSLVASRPSSTSSRRAARDSFCCRSTTWTGTRIVRAWFATARCTDWRIHQVA